MKPKMTNREEMPIVASLNVISARIHSQSVFLGFLPASPMKFGVPIGKHSVVGVHLFTHPKREPLSNSPNEKYFLDKKHYYVLCIVGCGKKFYRRFERKQEAIDWFHMIEVLDTASPSLLWAKEEQHGCLQE